MTLATDGLVTFNRLQFINSGFFGRSRLCVALYLFTKEKTGKFERTDTYLTKGAGGIQM